MITVDRMQFPLYVYSPVAPSLQSANSDALVESGAVIFGRQNEWSAKLTSDCSLALAHVSRVVPLLLGSLKIHVVLIFAGEDEAQAYSRSIHTTGHVETYLHTPIHRYDIFS